MAVVTLPSSTPAEPRLHRRERGELAVLLGIVAVMTRSRTGGRAVAASIDPR